MSEQVARTLSFFSKDSEAFVAEYPLRGIDLERLRQIFDVPTDDPMYDSWPVGPEQAAALQPFVTEFINLTRFDCFLESHAVPAPGVAILRGVEGHEGGE